MIPTRRHLTTISSATTIALCISTITIVALISLPCVFYNWWTSSSRHISHDRAHIGTVFQPYLFVYAYPRGSMPQWSCTRWCFYHTQREWKWWGGNVPTNTTLQNLNWIYLLLLPFLLLKGRRDFQGVWLWREGYMEKIEGYKRSVNSGRTYVAVIFGIGTGP